MFEVGKTYQTMEGDSARVVAIVPECFYGPMLVLTGACDIEFYQMDGRCFPNRQNRRDLRIDNHV